ncbi:hypothetical protein Pst134EB_026111 [Puccinia striiformis f. sp. tritici]|nr:hypothetical protein Pst134EB_026111 [Puccinia striiformis f. sp. tritici]
MTAPGSAWVGNQHLGDGLDFSSAHAGLFGQAAPTYPLQPNSLSASSLSKTPSADFSSSIRHLTHSSPGPSSVHTGGPSIRSPISHTDPPLDHPIPTRSFMSTLSSPPLRFVGHQPSEGHHWEHIRRKAHQTLRILRTLITAILSDTFTPCQPVTSIIHYGQILIQEHRPRSDMVIDLLVSLHSLDRRLAIHNFMTPIAPTHLSTLKPITMVPDRPCSLQHIALRSTRLDQVSTAMALARSSHMDKNDCTTSISYPAPPRKRARRRFDEVERLYDCNYPGCTKAYGTLNHLNAHIAMQKHGAKRLPQEFKEIRKEWRARKKAEAEARATALKQSANNNLSASHEYNVLNGQDCFRRHKVGGGVSNDSSPSGSSTSGGFAHNTMRSPAVGESYSAPAQSTHFVLNTTGDRHSNDWFNNDHRLNGTAIDEQPEYSVPHHQPTSSSSTSTQLSQPVPIDTLTHNLFGSHPRFMPNPNPPTPAHSQSHSNSNTLLHNHHHHSNNGIVGVSSHHLINRPAHILLNHSAAASIVDHS